MFEISALYKVWMMSHSAEEREEARLEERKVQLVTLAIGEGSSTIILGPCENYEDTRVICKDGSRKVWKMKEDRQDETRDAGKGGSKMVWKRKPNRADPDESAEKRRSTTSEPRE